MDAEKDTWSERVKTVIDQSIIDEPFDTHTHSEWHVRLSCFLMTWILHQRNKSPGYTGPLKPCVPNHFSVDRGTAISDEAFSVSSHWVNFLSNYFLGQISPLLISLDQINMNPMPTLSDTFI